MPVLVEATSVIIKRSAIDEKWPGGWESFVRGVPNQTNVANQPDKEWQYSGTKWFNGVRLSNSS